MAIKLPKYVLDILNNMKNAKKQKDAQNIYYNELLPAVEPYISGDEFSTDVSLDFKKLKKEAGPDADIKGVFLQAVEKNLINKDLSEALIDDEEGLESIEDRGLNIRNTKVYRMVDRYMGHTTEAGGPVKLEIDEEENIISLYVEKDNQGTWGVNFEEFDIKVSERHALKLQLKPEGHWRVLSSQGVIEIEATEIEDIEASMGVKNLFDEVLDFYDDDDDDDDVMETTKKVTERKADVQTIIQQLGGQGRLKAMVSAHDFVDLGNGLKFHFKGSRQYSGVKIELNVKDLYDVTFYKLRKGRATNEKTFRDIYAEDLKGVFEEETGLFLSL